MAWTGIGTAALIVGAATVPTAAPAVTVTTGNACLYSYDEAWRDLPVILDGTPDNVAGPGGSPITGTVLAPGDTVSLDDGTIAATLPEWLANFAWQGGLLSPGQNDLPLVGEIALEATNTVEGVRRARFEGFARVTITVNPDGPDDISPFTVDNLELEPVQWTAAGGRVAVRQAFGYALRDLPGALPQRPPGVRGSAYVHVVLPGGLTFGLQCLPGGFWEGGESHTATVAGAMATAEAPAFAAQGDVLPGPVRADVVQSSRPDPWPYLADPGASRSLGARLDLALSASQASEIAQELDLPHGQASEVDLQGEVDLAGHNVSPAAASAAIVSTTVTIDVSADGSTATAGPVQAPLAATAWTMGAARNVPGAIALNGANPVRLDFSFGDESLPVTLTRLTSASASSPVARIHPSYFIDYDWGPPPPPPPPSQGPPPVAPPSAPPVAAPPSTPPPAVSPPVRRVPSVLAGRLTADRLGRVAVRVRCQGNTACRGVVRLQSAAPLRVGNVRRPRTVAFGQRAYVVPAGRTAVIRVVVPRGVPRAVFTRARPRVNVRVTLQPRRGEGRAVNVRRVLAGGALVPPIRRPAVRR